MIFMASDFAHYIVIYHYKPLTIKPFQTVFLFLSFSNRAKCPVCGAPLPRDFNTV